MSPEAIAQYVNREVKKAQEEVAARASDTLVAAIEANDALDRELRGTLQTLWIVAKREPGGEIVINDEDFAQSSGGLQVVREEENKRYRFIALDPEPKEEETDEEPDGFSDDSDGYARSGDDMC